MNNMKSGKSNGAKGLRKSLLALSIIAAVPTYTFAQEAATDAAADVEVEKITVSGSRLKSRPGYDAPTPTTILDSTFVNEMANINIADSLTKLPSMNSGSSPTTDGNGVGGGGQGANILDIRGLGANRTLVLLDGKRVVGANQQGRVDINMIPSTLLKRTDIVSGGASAAYGSDAVSGVVNFILDKEYVGIKGSVQGGQSAESDGDEFKVEVAGGFEFAQGRGHILASINHNSKDGIERGDSRDWYKATKLVGNPEYANDPTQPQRLVLDNVGLFIGSDAGHTFLGPPPQAFVAGQTFTPDGAVVPFDFGTRFPNGPLSTSMTGDGQLNDFAARTQLSSEYEQTNIFARASYEISDDVEVYGEFMHGATEAQSLSVPYYRFAGALNVSRDNPFLPAELAEQMDNFGMTSVAMGRSNVDFGRANPWNDRDVTRLMVGVDAQLNDNWFLEAYYQRGESNIINQTRSNADVAKYALAVDAVEDDEGNIVCRSTRDTDPNNGCVAANVFGLGAPSQAAIDYVMGTAENDIELTQDVFAVTLSGDLFEMPAGTVSSSFGYEYRKEDLSSSADELSITNGWWVGNYKNASGDYDVNEVFAEVLLPIFYDSEFGESLDLNAAVRYTDYSTSGAVTTWKTGLSYNIGAGVSMRATKSRDIRAGNLNEYFSGGQTNTTYIDDTVTGATQRLVPRTISGNPQVAPEEADTTTIGIVYAPEFLEGLELSLDYLNIEVDDAIGTIADQDIVTSCNNGTRVSYCDLIERDPSTNEISRLFNAPVNFSVEVLTAWDFEASYNFELAGGDVGLHTLWTHTTEHYTVDQGVKEELLGGYTGGNGAVNGGPVEWVGLTSARYTNEGLSLSLRYRYIGEGLVEPEWTSGVEIDNNKVNSVGYFDFTASQKFDVDGTQIQIFASIDNLFDKEPPRVAFNTPFGLDDLGVAPSVHDTIGRYFRVGARFEF